MAGSGDSKTSMSIVSPATMLFADHVEAGQMGEHMREFRFPEPLALQSVRVVGRNEKPQPGSAFEGRTFPDFRTIALEVYASDPMSSSSTMPKLRASSPGVFTAPGERMITNCIVVRGKFIKLSVAIYGTRLSPDEVPALGDREFSGIPQHLRPKSTQDSDKLDLADFEDVDGSLGKGGEDDLNLDVLDSDRVPDSVSEAGAPASFGRALSLGGALEVNERMEKHAEWVASLPQEQDVLEGEAVIGRLENIANDIALLASRAPDNAAHVSLGPELARSLLALASRCVERLEFRPLRAALQALAACVTTASAAAEVLRMKGGLDIIISILRENEWCQTSSKLAALQALVQLCSHAAGMEAFLGWTDPTSKVSTAYEAVLSLALDGAASQNRLGQVAIVLLRRAGFYEALARLDSCCASLDGVEGLGEEQLQSEAAEALSEVAVQLEELSQPAAASASSQDAHSSLLGDDVPSTHAIEDASSKLPASIFGGCGTGLPASDPFAHGHSQLHGFLESFLAGRRLLPGLCILLRRLPRMPPQQRLAIFRPLQRLVCALLSCTGGPQLLAADTATLASFLSLLETSTSSSSRLPAVPRFPAALVQSDMGAPQLAGLVATHVRALRLSLLLIARTRLKGRAGLLPEADTLPLVAALHRLCVRGSAGRGAVVAAFRSTLLAEWLLRQLEGRLEEASPVAGGASQAALLQPSMRHLVAILHALVQADASAAAAERFGGRALALVMRALQMMEPEAEAEGGEGGRGRASLEFALDSEGAEGGLGQAVRIGRRSADAACVANLRELAVQLRPWRQSDDGDAMVTTGSQLPMAPVTTAKLLASLQLTKGPRSLKRSANEERGSRRSALLLGGHAGANMGGVEIPEVDFSMGIEAAGDHAEVDDHERFPAEDPAELPLLAMRLLCRRAANGTREALQIEVSDEQGSDGSGAHGKDGISRLVPWIIRCAGAFNLNLEALILQEEQKQIASIYATRRAHGQLLEATLQTTAHLLRGLKDSGVMQYRHTELLQSLLLLAQRLTSGLASLAPGSSAAGDPEMKLLWHHCLVWVCRVFRLWVQSFPSAAGGQLLQPLLRHARVMPTNFASGLLLLATCGSLKNLLPSGAHTFSLHASSNPPAAGESLQSQWILFPASTRGGAPGMAVLRSSVGPDAAPGALWGQFCDKKCEAADWEAPERAAALACGEGSSDPLVRALARERQTAVAQALGLVELVNSRRERLSMDDVGELVALVAQCALTSDALLHLCTARVLEKLNVAGVPVLGTVLRLAEAALNGVVLSSDSNEAPGADGDNISGGAARDPRDARAVSRLLLLLTHFGASGPTARCALGENQAETICLQVLAHPASTLPPFAVTQAIRLLGLMFSAKATSGKDRDASLAPGGPSLPKCRMVSKAVSLLINRAQEDTLPPNAATMAAALELLHALCSSQWLCLNLLFSACLEDTTGEDDQVPVTVSGAFKLAQCSQRLVKELLSRCRDWQVAEKGSEDETLAQEDLASWLQVTELLAELCRVVVRHCPTASAFLNVVMPGIGAPGVLADIQQVLNPLAAGQIKQGANTLAEQAAAIVRAISTLQSELQAKPEGPPPATLLAKDLMSPQRRKKNGVSNGSTPSAMPEADTPSDQSEADVVAEVVTLLDAASDLEANPEWSAVAELDAAEPPANMDWEFDAGTLRKKRQAFLEKSDADRKAKRLKTQQMQVQQRADAAAAAARRRDAPVAGPPPAAAPRQADAGAPVKEEAAAAPVKEEAAPPATATKQEAPAPAPVPVKAAGINPAEALQSFLKDHPEFMRVLQNPKKCLADPRVKSMFMSELQNYPAVKSFLATKGLKLDE